MPGTRVFNAARRGIAGYAPPYKLSPAVQAEAAAAQEGASATVNGDAGGRFVGADLLERKSAATSAALRNQKMRLSVCTAVNSEMHPLGSCAEPDARVDHSNRSSPGCPPRLSNISSDPRNTSSAINASNSVGPTIGRLSTIATIACPTPGAETSRVRDERVLPAAPYSATGAWPHPFRPRRGHIRFFNSSRLARDANQARRRAESEHDHRKPMGQQVGHLAQPNPASWQTRRKQPENAQAEPSLGEIHDHQGRGTTAPRRRETRGRSARVAEYRHRRIDAGRQRQRPRKQEGRHRDDDRQDEAVNPSRACFVLHRARLP